MPTALLLSMNEATILVGAVALSFATVYRLGVWLFPKGQGQGPDAGTVDVASLPWREYEDRKRQGCSL